MVLDNVGQVLPGQMSIWHLVIVEEEPGKLSFGQNRMIKKCWHWVCGGGVWVVIFFKPLFVDKVKTWFLIDDWSCHFFKSTQCTFCHITDTSLVWSSVFCLNFSCYLSPLTYSCYCCPDLETQYLVLPPL